MGLRIDGKFRVLTFVKTTVGKMGRGTEIHKSKPLKELNDCLPPELGRYALVALVSASMFCTQLCSQQGRK